MIRVARCSPVAFDRMDQECACNHLGVFCRCNYAQFAVVIFELNIFGILREFRHKFGPPDYCLFVKSQSDFDVMNSYIDREHNIQYRFLSQARMSWEERYG